MRAVPGSPVSVSGGQGLPQAEAHVPPGQTGALGAVLAEGHCALSSEPSQAPGWPLTSALATKSQAGSVLLQNVPAGTPIS